MQKLLGTIFMMTFMFIGMFLCLRNSNGAFIEMIFLPWTKMIFGI
jgi:hypothetical protein